MKPEFVFIVNPVAGRHDSDTIIKNITKVCRKRRLDFQIIKTEYPKHATEIVKNLPKKGKLIFSVGGDGTMHEVLQSIMKTDNLMGIIPNGTGNDFHASLAKVKDQKPQIDVGVFNHKHYFLNYVGMGFTTDVTVAITRKFRKKWIPKQMRFTLAILNTLATFRPLQIKFNIHGVTKSEKSTVIVAANGQRFGGEYHVAPDADLQDGEMDICFVDAMSIPALIPLISSVKTGEHIKNPNVHMRKTDHVKIYSDKKVNFDVDGELFEDHKIDIKILKKALTFYNDQSLVKDILRG
jgi:YegS/Rv2252/BmrU family lipid kinase